MRAHFTRPVTDQQGNLLPNVQVNIYEPGTTTLIADVIYSTDVGNNVLTNPFVSNTGIVDIYLDAPKRVRLSIVQGNLPPQFYDDVDVIASGADSPHTGTGLQSLVIGVMATAVGNQSTAVGQGANSPGASSTALGVAASALGASSVAIGSAAVQGAGAVGVGDQSQATGASSVAIGQGAVAVMADGVALGHAALAPYVHSTALGSGATTTGPNQVMLGTADDVVEVAQGAPFVMTAPNGSRWLFTIDNNGSLITTLA